jgi:hypothetical protein
VLNINVSAGLVNSCTGFVVKVIYNNADVSARLQGKMPPPHCLVVDFPSFLGFLSKDQPGQRIFPILEQPHWVLIFRDKFHPEAVTDVPSWIRKKQLPGKWYREQFPLDLSRHITVHRAQGQTMRDCIVLVDLHLNNPNSTPPQDVASLLYVACTRVHQLKDLIVAPIFPSVWEKTGRSEGDKERRNVEERLKAALEFAALHSKYVEVKEELSWTPDYKGNGQEWNDMQRQSSAPTERRGLRSYQHVARDGIRTTNGESSVSLCLKPAYSERHIGVEQGRTNFGIVAVDKVIDGLPTIVATELKNLELRSPFNVADAVLALKTQNESANMDATDTADASAG